jgi:hypothetical protein
MNFKAQPGQIRTSTFTHTALTKDCGRSIRATAPSLAVDTTSGKLVATIEPGLSRGRRDRIMAEVRYALEDRSSAPWRADGWDATRGFQLSRTPNLVQVLRNN